MNDLEAYEVWNGGQGNLVVLGDDKYIDPYISNAWEAGLEAKLCGRIAKKPTPMVTIQSKFNGDVVNFRS